MIFLFLMFSIALAMGLGLAWQLLRSSDAPLPPVGGVCFERNTPELRRYHVMARLCREEDLKFLSSQPSLGAIQRMLFRAKRRRILRLYLAEMRRDFMKTWSLCRTLAPFMRDRNFGTLLLEQFLAFHSLFGLLWLCAHCLSGPRLHANIDGVVKALQRMRQVARETMRATEALAHGSQVAAL